jgi:transposase InsO family protein
MARHQGEHDVRLMCAVLEVAPSGYYAWRKRAPSARAIADERLLLNIRVAHTKSGETYGAPRVQRELREEGIGVGTNLLDRQFDVNGVALNRIWVSDITYIPTQEGWLYLAAVLDLASRRCVGWAMRGTLDAELAVSALAMAIAARRPEPGLIHHSDRGSQYTCADYRELLAAHGMIASMSRKGNCWDNAVAESFFATLELEVILNARWETRDEARRAIFRYIETWYNRERRHSTLDYISPAAYEERLQSAA